MPKKITIQRWLAQRGLVLQPGFTEELQTLAMEYKKISKFRCLTAFISF